MISYLGSLVLFSRAAGRAVSCRQTSLCVGSTPCVPATLGLPRSRVSVLSRLHCSGSRLLYMECALRCLRFQFSCPPQKHGLGWTCVLCLPRRSSSGRQELAGRTLPAAAPASVSTSRVPAPCVCSGELASSLDPPGGCRPSTISGSLWLETGGLFAVWWGRPPLGLSLPLSPPPCLLPLAGVSQSSTG